MLKVNCPECDKTIRVSPEKAGARVKCSQCGTAVRIPSSSEEVEDYGTPTESRRRPKGKGKGATKKSSGNPALVVGGIVGGIALLLILSVGVYLLAASGRAVVNTSPDVDRVALEKLTKLHLSLSSQLQTPPHPGGTAPAAAPLAHGALAAHGAQGAPSAHGTPPAHGAPTTPTAPATSAAHASPTPSTVPTPEPPAMAQATAPAAPAVSPEPAAPPVETPTAKVTFGQLPAKSLPSGSLKVAGFPENCAAVLVAHPARLMESGVFKKLFPADKLPQFPIESFPPDQMEEVVVWVAAPLVAMDTATRTTIAVRFKTPIPPEQVIPPAPIGMVVSRVDDRTLWLGGNESAASPAAASTTSASTTSSGGQSPSASTLKSTLESAPESDLHLLIDTGGRDLLADANELLKPPPGAPAGASPLAALSANPLAEQTLHAMRKLDLKLDLTSSKWIDLSLKLDNANTASQLASALQTAITPTPNVPFPVALIMKSYSSATQIAARDTGVSVVFTTTPDLTKSTIGFLKPMVDNAMETSAEAMVRAQLQQVGVGLQAYHAAYAKFPLANSEVSVLKDGQPLLSWRVHLLPFLGETDLYQEFHINEPWDSPHNQTLLKRRPSVYATPGVKDPTKTAVLTMDADFSVISSTRAGKSMQDMTDGTSNTVVAFIAGESSAVPWTAPQALTWDEADPWKGFGPFRGPSLLMLLADGSIREVKRTLSKEALKALFTPSGGEAP